MTGEPFDCAQGQRGMAMLMTLAILVVVSALAGTTVLTLRSLMRDSVYQKRLLQAQAIADAGSQDAMRQLVSSGTWRTGFSQKPFAGGYYTVSLSTHTRPWITATGYSPTLALLGRAVRTVKFKANVLPVTRKPYALICRKKITTEALATVDSYNSETATDPVLFSTSAVVWTNQDVGLALGSVISGNLFYFSGSAPPAGTVLGTVTKSTYTQTLLYFSGSGYVNDNDNLTGLQPQTYYNPGNKDLHVTAGSTATIKTGVYYFNRVDIDGRLDVKITNGPVVIFFDANLTVTSGGVLNNPTHIPGNLLMYAQTVNTIAVDSTTPIYAVIEARTADLTLNSAFYGGISGDTCVLEAGARLHQDLSMQRPQINTVRVTPGTWTSTYAKQ